MKNRCVILISPIAIMGVLFMLISSCNHDTEDVSLPELSTNEISDITLDSTTCGGVIDSDGGSTVTRRGVCWSVGFAPNTSNNKTIDGSGIGSFTSYITDYTAGTKYYVRAYATNVEGTAYGELRSFTKITIPQIEDIVFNPDINYGTITDIDGNTYKTIDLGTQTWMAENLKTSKFRNGDAITNVTDSAKWSNLTSEAYCYYNNTSNSDTINIYGKLYNWYAVTDSREICPVGWHMPTHAEWSKLTDYVGGHYVAGGECKETGTRHWASPNTGANNRSGFTALPGGYRSYNGTFENIGYRGYWWDAPEDGTNIIAPRDMAYNYSNLSRYYSNKEFGFSVRCMKD